MTARWNLASVVNDGYKLGTSVWDASLLIGLPNVGVLFVLVLQLLICQIIMTSLGRSFTTTEESIHWRASTAHHSTWADSFGSSLASRVCNRDRSLSVSTSQFSLVGDLQAYEQAFLSVPQGALLCLLVCCSRLVLFLTQLQRVGLFLSCVSESWRTSKSDHEGSSLKVSSARFFAIWVVMLLHVAVLSFTSWVVVSWVFNTTSLYLIVVLAASLGFICDLDQNAFKTLVTRRTRALVTDLQPLPRPASMGGTILLLSTSSVTAWVSLAVLIAFSVPRLSANVDTMSDLLNELCGGNLDFVAFTTQHADLVTVAESKSYGDFLAQDLTFLALQEAVWIEELRNVTLSSYAPDRFWFGVSSIMEAGERDAVTTCLDVDILPEVITVLYRLPDGLTCADVAQHCFSARASFLRSVCPLTCGCAHPQSGLTLTESLFGCPTDACRGTESYRVAFQEIACETPNVEALQANANWTSNLENLRTTFEDLSEPEGALLVDRVSAEGCSAVSLYDSSDLLCRGGALYSSLTAWCPVECGCRVPPSSNAKGYFDHACPPQCDDWRSRYLQTLGTLTCTDLDGPSRTPESEAALDLHFEVFGTFSLSSDHAHYSSVRAEGCEGLELKWCGSPWMIRALCPVLCGCIEAPRQAGCPSSCLDTDASTGSANLSLA